MLFLPIILLKIILFIIRETANISSESEDEIEVGGGKGKHDLLVKQESKPGFFKQSKKQYPMFPFAEEKIKIDEYGEIIKYTQNIILLSYFFPLNNDFNSFLI